MSSPSGSKTERSTSQKIKYQWFVANVTISTDGSTHLQYKLISNCYITVSVQWQLDTKHWITALPKCTKSLAVYTMFCISWKSAKCSKCSLNYIWKARMSMTFKVIENRSAIWYFLLVVCIYCVYLAPFLRHYHFHSVLAACNFAKSFISNKQLALKATDAFWLMYTHTHTHTRLTALCPGLPGWAGTRKVKPIWIYWSKKQWVAVASAGPYASLHLAPDR